MTASVFKFLRFQLLAFDSSNLNTVHVSPVFAGAHCSCSDDLVVSFDLSN